MADTRMCEQCGVWFAPRREHARFCSARCRVTWNRRHAGDPPAQTAALDWSITAMREAIDRLGRADGRDLASGFAVISEAVWWVTIVDATLVRYHPDIHNGVLAGQPPAQRRVTEDIFGGLRFVRNQMDHDQGHAGFIQPRDSRRGAAAGGVASWIWKPVAEPAVISLTPRGQDWEMTRYRAYQAQLAGHPIGETFVQAAGFLRLVTAGSLSA